MGGGSEIPAAVKRDINILIPAVGAGHRSVGHFGPLRCSGGAPGACGGPIPPCPVWGSPSCSSPHCGFLRGISSRPMARSASASAFPGRAPPSTVGSSLAAIARCFSSRIAPGRVSLASASSWWCCSTSRTLGVRVGGNPPPKNPSAAPPRRVVQQVDVVRNLSSVPFSHVLQGHLATMSGPACRHVMNCFCCS